MGHMMTSFIPLLQQLIIGNLAGSRPPLRIFCAGMILRVLSFILLLVGLFLVIYAEYIWLGIFLPPYLATLMTALTLITTAALIEIIGKMINKKEEAKASSHLDITGLLTDIIGSLDEDLEGSIRTNPKTAVLISTLSGFMAGKKII